MNKAFNTNPIPRVKGKAAAISRMKWLAGQSCHIKVGEPMLLKDHPLCGEIFAKLDSGELVLS